MNAAANAPAEEAVMIAVDSTTRVSGLWQRPPGARCSFLFAHGAGAGMRHPFMAAFAADLAALGVATLRYQFPFMERRARRPDPPAVCQVTVRAAVEEAARLGPDLPLIAGGKSFGGRMTSAAQAALPLREVRGLAFLAFPLHAAKRPSDSRGMHLENVRVPMLFLQGTNDELAELTRLQALVARLGSRATLHLLQHANHAFHVPARSGRRDPEIRTEMARTLADWAKRVMQ